MKRAEPFLVASYLVLACAAPATAGVRTASFSVSLVVNTASIVATLAVENLDFGTTVGQRKYAQSIVRVTAPQDLNYTVAIDGGQHAAIIPPLVFLERYLSGGTSTDLMAYELCQDPAFSRRWGDGNVNGLG